MSNTILTKKIGTTTYKVNVYFNQNAVETMEENFYGYFRNIHWQTVKSVV